MISFGYDNGEPVEDFYRPIIPVLLEHLLVGLPDNPSQFAQIDTGAFNGTMSVVVAEVFFDFRSLRAFQHQASVA